MKSPFTATPLQVVTYLVGVALFSISFLVFLNSSVSFVITDLIGQKDRVGDAVGTLGFADELLALAACPLWGLISDRIGVRSTCVAGYAVVGLSFFVFVQARNVYPDLLLARLLFSVGGAATSTMVTACLAATTAKLQETEQKDRPEPPRRRGHKPNLSVSSETTITPDRYTPSSSQALPNDPPKPSPPASASQVAGLVGMFTGLGALLGLFGFFPLPARLQEIHVSRPDAVVQSFYIVGGIAFAVAIFCAFGLHGIAGEGRKSFQSLLPRNSRMRSREEDDSQHPSSNRTGAGNLLEAVKLGFTETSIGLGYVGGFVARASSVAITLFIPLFVNAYFISSGLCKDGPATIPEEIKAQCRRAYTVAAMLSGVSQLIALLSAPLFGLLDHRYGARNLPIMLAALCGIAGYIAFAQISSPDPKSEHGTPAVFSIMALLGISQIGAIVCSLSSLTNGIRAETKQPNGSMLPRTSDEDESAALLSEQARPTPAADRSRNHLKGSIAGVYSLAGGLGILILTKLGGLLFDRWTPGAPFYMLAIFNGILFCTSLICTIAQSTGRKKDVPAMD